MSLILSRSVTLPSFPSSMAASMQRLRLTYDVRHKYSSSSSLSSSSRLLLLSSPACKPLLQIIRFTSLTCHHASSSSSLSLLGSHSWCGNHIRYFSDVVDNDNSVSLQTHKEQKGAEIINILAEYYLCIDRAASILNTSNDTEFIKKQKDSSMALLKNYEKKLFALNSNYKIPLRFYSIILPILRHYYDSVGNYNDDELQDWLYVMQGCVNALPRAVETLKSIQLNKDGIKNEKHQVEKRKALQDLHNYYVIRIAMETKKAAYRNDIDSMRDAEEILQQMKNTIPITLEAYNSIIYGYLSLYERLKQHTCLDAAKKWMANIEADGIKPIISTFNLWIQCFAKMNQETQMREWVNKMKESGIQANEATYLSVLQFYVNAERKEEVKSVIEDMKAEGIQLNNRHNLVISLCRKLDNIGMSDESASLQQMISESPTQGADLNPYYNQITDYIKSNRIIDAIQMIDNIGKQYQVKPDTKWYNAILNYYYQKGDLKEFNNYLNKMKQDEIPFNRLTFGYRIHFYAKLYMKTRDKLFLTKLRHAVKTMQESGFILDEKMYTTLAAAYSRCGDFPLLETLYQSIIKSSSSSSSSSFSSISTTSNVSSHFYSASVYGYAMYGRIIDVRRWINHAKQDNKCDENVYNGALSGLHAVVPETQEITQLINEIREEMNQRGMSRFKRK